MALHIPVTYLIQSVEGVVSEDGTPAYDIIMQDLVAEMTRPCAMALIMGTRTVTAAELAEGAATPRAELLQEINRLDQHELTDEERAAGGVSARRYLSFLDARSSTASLGFRIDSGKTLVDKKLDTLPLPRGLPLDALREEADVQSTFGTFVQCDRDVAAAFLLKLETFAAVTQAFRVEPSERARWAPDGHASAAAECARPQSARGRRVRAAAPPTAAPEMPIEMPPHSC